MNLKRIILTSFILLQSSTALAVQLSTKGFLTFAYSRSNTEELYQGDISDEGEFTQGSIAGLQFSSILSSKTEAYLQMAASGDDGRNFNFSVDTAHITYNFNNKHKVLLGKIRLPVYMISDHRQVGYLIPWIIPPEEVYEIVPFEEVGSNETFFGASLEGKIYNKGKHKLDYRLYTGGSESSGEGGVQSRVKNLIGSSIDYSFDRLELKLSYLNTLSSSTQADNNGDGDRDDISKGRTEFLTAGMKIDTDQYMLMSEYSQTRSEALNFEDIKSYYLLGGLYFDEQQYLLHATYSTVLDSSKSDIDVFQKSLTLGANYFVDFSTVLKLEFKRVFLKKPPKPDPDFLDRPRDAGFFDRHPGKDVDIISLSVDTVF